MSTFTWPRQYQMAEFIEYTYMSLPIIEYYLEKQAEGPCSSLFRASLLEAKKINNVSLHIQSAYELNFLDEFFDAVVILNSLHVMKTPQLALNEMKRVMKPESFLFAPTYCHAETKEILENYEKWALKSGHKSYHMFTCETLCDLISSCGFCIKKKDVMLISHGGKNGVMAIGYIVAIPDS